MRIAIAFLLMFCVSAVTGQGKQNTLDDRLKDLMFRIGLEDNPSGFNDFEPAQDISIPEQLAQQQLDAYNARDINAFLVPYHDEVEIYNFPDELRMNGIDAMRKSYEPFFANTPNLHCELVNRIVMGNTVIDQEHVTGLQNGQSLDAIAVYRIEEGKIKSVWFIR